MPDRSYPRKMVSMDIRLEEIKQWLQTDPAIRDFSIEPASADASFRRYFRVRIPPGKSWIVMDAPPDKEDCTAFIDIAGRLIKAGVNAPEVKAYSAERGFMLLTDLGNTVYLDKLNAHNADELYRAAIDSLIHLQQVRTDCLPVYDETLLRQEMDLFRDWLLVRHLELNADYDWLDDIFDFLIGNALEQPQLFVHRDYHSRNLTWQDGQSPGILDFQDAVVGPLTYDLVSLLRDCYIQWPYDRVVNWVKYYCDSVQKKGLLRDRSDTGFLRWFDLMGVQRHLKASGIFARLWHRDGKNGYLNDIPRTVNYLLETSHRYPELKDLEYFLITTVIPAIKDKQT